MTKEPPQIPAAKLFALRTKDENGNPTLKPMTAEEFADYLRQPVAGLTGNHNHRTMRETVAEARDKARGLTPYGYLMSVMKDEDADPYLRVMAAEALLPYCHKKE